MRGICFILLILGFVQVTNASFLDKLNSKVNSVNSITDGADRVKGNTVDKYARTESLNNKRMKEWNSEVKIAEKAMQKVCKKKIAVEFDSARFKSFLAIEANAGAYCVDAFKALEYDLCPDSNFKNEVKNEINAVKCMYTTGIDYKPKFKIAGKTLMVGFGENTSEIYEETNTWLQNKLKK